MKLSIKSGWKYKAGRFYLSVLIAILAAPTARSADVTWLTATGTNDWFNGANWVGGSAPTNGDNVFITNNNVGVLLTNSTPMLSLLQLSNSCSLIFSNWDTALSATNVTILPSATVTHVGESATTTNGAGQWIPDARVWIVCTNLTIASSASINANARGYTGRSGANNYGRGPGGGYYVGGGGHGGRGGPSGSGGQTYGNATSPVTPGSAGGNFSGGGTGGHGGGAVQIDASSAVTINGTITAVGQSISSAGAGSGGGIYITCDTLTGSGTITAAGGVSSTHDGGGGGRISVIYNPASQAAIAPVPSVRFLTPGGSGVIGWGGYGDVGTLYFPDNAFLSNTFRHAGQWLVTNFTSWSANNMLFTNAWLRLPADGFTLTVTNDLEIAGTDFRSHKLELYNSMVVVGDDLTMNKSSLVLYRGATSGPSLYCDDLSLTNTTALYLYSGLTNIGGANDRGALAQVSKNITIAPNSVIYLYSHPTNGGSALLRMRHLTVAAGGSINADAGGFAARTPASDTWGWGPGGGYKTGGGGYGGQSSAGSIGGAIAGGTYGSSNAPIDPGSGSGCYAGGYSSGAGGGLVRLVSSGIITLNGSLTANGETPSGSGGSGGGIYISCRTFAGGGLVRANGGDCGGGGYAGGGGGRIAVWRTYDSYSGSVPSVRGGTNTPNPIYSGKNGTVVWGNIPLRGTIFTVM